MSERQDMPPEIDEEVQAAYRALPDENVPIELDAKVMQAASAALNQKRKPAWLKWSAPIALAASVLVVVAVVLDPSAHKEAIEPRVLSAPRSMSVTADLPAAQQAHEPAQPAALARDAASAQLARQEAKRAHVAEENARREVAAASRQSAEQPKNVTVAAQRPAEALQDVPIATPVLPEAELDEAQSARKSDAFANAAPVAPPPPKIEINPPTLPQASPAPMLSGTLSNAAAAAARVAEPTREKEEIVMAARDPKIDASLRNIHELQQAGKKRAAERAMKKLHEAYPELDIDAELQRLSEAEKAPR